MIKKQGDRSMIFIDSNSTDPRYNLALEQFVFDQLPSDQSYLMLWQNHNTIVVGKHQNTREEINEAYVYEKQISVVRRLSGGGTVYHDMGNLNYTFITDDQYNDSFRFDVFTKPIIDTLAEIGIHAEFNSRNDITIKEQKFSGSAQYTKNGRVMHHGTLMFSSDLSQIPKALNPNKDKFQSKSTKSVRSRVCNISDHLQSPMTLNAFKSKLIAHITKTTKLALYTLNEQEEKQVKEIALNRYSSWDWVYGRSPIYRYNNRQRFSFGAISISADIKKGQIHKILISGDFFGSGDLQELENHLIGCKVEQSELINRLKELNLSSYINGLKPEQLAGLISNPA
jgi:lipoate-protein ligase A